MKTSEYMKTDVDSLARVGVRLLGPMDKDGRISLQCMTCGATWSPNLRLEGSAFLPPADAVVS